MKCSHHLKVLLILCTLLLITACEINNNDNAVINPNTSITGLSRDKIFYSSIGMTASGGTLRELYVINADNTEHKQLTFNNNGSPAAFVRLTRDGFVVYGGGSHLYSVPLANPSISTTKIIASDLIYGINPISVTTDNRVIYYVGWDLYSVKADGSEGPKTLNPGLHSYYVGLTNNNLVVYGDNNGLHAVEPRMSQPAITLSSNASDTDAKIIGNTVVFYSADNPGYYKVDASIPSPQRILLVANAPHYLLNAVNKNHVIYTTATGKIWKVNMDGSGSVQLTSTLNDDDTFITLSSDNRVIYQKRSGADINIYSVAATGGVETLIAANASTNDYVGVTNDNRVIVQYAVDPLYRTIISVKSDGTGLITLAAGNSGVTAGGYVWLVTPDGWVVYGKGTGSTTMTSVKADNSDRGTFENFQGKMGVTSTNRIVATMLDGNKLRIFSVIGNGSEKLRLDTENVESILLITP